MHLNRTHYCGLLTKEDINKKVVLAGWVQVKRDHGGLIFLDLRDRSGIVQVVFDSQRNASFFSEAERLRAEYVIAVKGEVKHRSPDTVNLKLATGAIEVYAEELEVINSSQTPPFYIEDGIDTDENLRLKYRYLDLRRFEMQRALEMRHKVMMSARQYLDEHGFWEIETPMLTRSTPEGARDFLVPSRTSPGNFFALPQSPQLFKQLLMVSGIDRYFQIARCFRDEDLRADRQPEFTQIDIEMSFCSNRDIMREIEGLIAYLFKRVLHKEIKTPFAVLTYKEAMERFGSDKPDTRFAMEIVDISEIAGQSAFQVFKGIVEKGGVVKGLNARKCGHFSRKELDDLTRLVQSWGTGGMAWIVLTEDGFKTPLAKFFTSSQLLDIKEKLQGEPGDLLLFVADQWETALKVMGQLRLHLAGRLGLIPQDQDHFLWVIDFPLLTYDQEAKRYTANHHPFTAPLEEDTLMLDEEPLAVRSQAYDLVYNGVEVAGGSIRIHKKELQQKIFQLLNISTAEAEEKFGFFLTAFEYGVPPHGGIAFGLDRLIMLMSGKKSIRDVIPFPKTAGGTCLLTGAPAPVSPEQQKELHISTILRENKKEKMPGSKTLDS
ncbi:MAG: aspartate--tRNA ligase [Firmicutes bacterium]|jgi:aspartyl-tRNA synthetase|nr:aspartate--tRNA ligase [Bacillota bacterium]